MDAIDEVKRKAITKVVGFDPDEEAQRAELGGPWQGQEDALRHMLLAGGLTQRYGAVPARAATGLYEAITAGNYTPQGRADAAMDLINNEAGIELGRKTSSLSELLAQATELARKAPKRRVGLGDVLSTQGPVVLDQQQDYYAAQ